MRTAPHASRMADSEVRGQPAALEDASPGPRPAQGASAARDAGCCGGASLIGSAARWTKSVHASMGQPRGERSGSDLKREGSRCPSTTRRAVLTLSLNLTLALTLTLT